MAQKVKSLPAIQEIWVLCLSREDPLDKEMATPSSILDLRISWTEGPARLQSMEFQGVVYDQATNTYLLTYLRVSFLFFLPVLSR